MNRYFLLAAVAFILAEIPAYLSAQTRSNTSQNSGNTGTGTAAANRGTAGNFGSSNNTQATQGIDAAAGSSENINRDFGNGFVGRGDSADRFVGNQQAGPQQLNQQGPNFRQRNNGNVQGGETGRSSQVRPRIVLAPELTLNQNPQLQPDNPTMKMEKLLNQQLQSRAAFAQLQVSSIQNGIITLRGTVVSARDLKLAESLLRLDPAVRRVEQQVIILSQP